jgi:hypothetical protein
VIGEMRQSLADDLFAPGDRVAPIPRRTWNRKTPRTAGNDGLESARLCSRVEAMSAHERVGAEDGDRHEYADDNEDS